MRQSRRCRKVDGPMIKVPGQNVFQRGLSELQVEGFYAAIDKIRTRKFEEQRRMMPGYGVRRDTQNRLGVQGGQRVGQEPLSAQSFAQRR